MPKDNPDKPISKIKKQANISGRVLAFLIAVMVLAPLAVLHGCGVKSEPVYDTGIEPWQATEAQIERASQLSGSNKLMVGCWIPPRPHQVTNDEEADARMKEVAESGINMIVTHHSDLEDMDFIHRIVKASAKYGVDVIIELNTDLSDDGIEFNLGVVRDTMGYGNVIGYNLYDEPIEGHRAALTKEYGLVKELVPEKIVMLNLLPNYGPADTMAPTVTKGLTKYQTYVDNFAQTGTDVISFDFYPFQAGGETIAFGTFLMNFCDLITMARKYDRPIWGFLQNCSFAGMLLPDEAGIRLDAHCHLLLGAKSYSYFLYAQPFEPQTPTESFDGMLRWTGKLTPTYTRVKNVNSEIANFKNRVLSYDISGIYAERLSKDHKSCVNKSLRVTSGTKFKSITTNLDYEVLAGVFKPRSADANAAAGCSTDTADEALYVVNYSRANKVTATVAFKGVQEYTVWGPGGIESMGAASEVTLELPEGDARFIEFKTFTD